VRDVARDEIDHQAHFEGEIWDAPLSPWEHRRIAWISANIPDDVHTVLDVGCGDGRLTHVLADKGFEITGVDGSPRALAKVRTPKKLSGVDQIDFPDDSFDLVLCTEVLEHLPDEVHRKTLAELSRLARRYVLVSVPNREQLKLAMVRCPSCRLVFHAYGHLRSYTPEQVAGLLPGAELTEVCPRHTALVWHPTLVWLRFDVLGRYGYCPTAVCPRCGADDFSRQRWDLARAVLSRLSRLAARGKTREGGFILSRFRVG